MIIPSNIPLDADTFLRNCRYHKSGGNYAPSRAKCKDFLTQKTEELAGKNPNYRGLLDYLRRVQRQEGQQRLHAQADHIIPHSVWRVLMPRDLIEPDEVSGVLCNLCWRHSHSNLVMDDLLIVALKMEFLGIDNATVARFQKLRGKEHEGAVALWGQEWEEWSKRWIEIFLRTKHDEEVPFAGVYIDPFQLDRMTEANWPE